VYYLWHQRNQHQEWLNAREEGGPDFIENHMLPMMGASLGNQKGILMNISRKIVNHFDPILQTKAHYWWYNSPLHFFYFK